MVRKGNHYVSFWQHGNSLIAASYCQDIACVNKKLRNDHPGLINRDRPVLLHDNARSYISRATVDMLKYFHIMDRIYCFVSN